MNLEPEVLCGFEVSKNRKRLWAVEKEMLEIILNICKKYSIQVFAVSGTAIGAVRHNGFIPWDDDIDLAMLRADYNKFLNVVEKELPDGFFADSYRTQKGCVKGHFQLRNNNTTCLLKGSYRDLKSNKNCGVFVDVFPYDNIPDDEIKRRRYFNKIKKDKYFANLILHPGSNKVKALIKKVIAKILFINPEKYIMKLENDSQMYNKVKCAKISCSSFLPDEPRFIWDSDMFNEVVMHKFEDIEIPIPKKYDIYLKKSYGDYMQFPHDLGDSMHGEAYFDLDNSYTTYSKLTEKQFEDLFKNKSI